MFPGMHDTAQELRYTVKRYLERTGVAPSQLGKKAVNNPSFVAKFLNGSSPQLKTADRVLKTMGLEPIGPRFRREMKAYLTITGASRSTPGKEVLNDTSFVRRVLKGGSAQLETMDRVRDWMRQSTNAEEWRLVEIAGAASDDGLPPGLDEGPNMHPCELASELKVTERTLLRWREEGKGPEFYRDGRFVRYARAKVNAWLRSIERSSTSNPGQEPPGTYPRSPQEED